MRKIKVLQVIDSLEKGGAETMAVNFANNLDRETFESHICVTRRMGSLRDELKNVAVFFLGRSCFFDPGSIWKLRSYLLREKIDLIHSHGTAVFIAEISRILSGNKIIHVMTDHSGKVGTRRALMYRLFLQRTDLVLIVSEHLRRWWIDNAGFSESKIHHVPNGICYDDLFGSLRGVSKNDSQIIHCANFWPRKDHFTLIKAAAVLKNRGVKFKILLIGKATIQEYFNSVKSEIKKSGLEEHIIVKGQVLYPGRDICESSIGILTSLGEALPLSLLEYMGAGLPVVVTDVGDCKSVLDRGEFGFLISPGDANGLADALEKLLKDKTLRDSYGESAKKIAYEGFDIKVVISRIEDIYLSLLNSQEIRIGKDGIAKNNKTCPEVNK